MATRLYATAAAAPVTPSEAVYDDAGGASDALPWDTPANLPGAKKLARSGNWPGATTFATISQAKTATANDDTCAHVYVSDPLVGAQTISGTIQGQLLMAESATSANAHAQCAVKVVSNDGSTLRGILWGGDTRTGTVDEFAGTSPVNEQIPSAAASGAEGTATAGVAPISSVSAQDGDRIVFEVGMRANTTTATRTVSVRHGSTATAGGANDLTTAGAESTDLNGWIEFSANLNFDVAGATYTQNGYRFYKDDAGANAATARAAANTNISMVADRNLRVRFNINATVNPPTQNKAFELYYSKNGGTYTRVDASSSNVRASASSQFTDGAATTEQLAGAGTFNAGTIDEADGSAAGFTATPATGQDTEVAYCIQIRSTDVAAGDTLDFRAYSGGAAIDSYTQTPRATVIVNPAGEVRTPLTDPTTTLATGASTGEFRGRFRKLVNGALTPTANPTVTIEIRDGVANGATVLKTLATNQAISTTTSDGQLVSATFDQSGISTPSSAALWLTTTNVVGASVAVLPQEWNAQTAAGGPTTVQRTISATATGSPSFVRRPNLVRAYSATGAPLQTKTAQKLEAMAATGAVLDAPSKVSKVTISASGTATPAFLKRTNLTRAYTAAGTPAFARTLSVLRSISASATGTAADAKQASLVRAYTATGTEADTRQARLARAYSATGTATLVPLKAILRSIAAAATGAAVDTKQTSRLESASGTGTPQWTKQARLARSYAAAGTPALSRVLAAFRSIAANASGTAVIVAQLQSGAQQFSRTISAAATGTAAFLKQARAIRSYTASGTAADTKQARVVRAYSAAGTATLAPLKALLRSIAATAAGTATFTRLEAAVRSITASATGTAVDTKQARRSVAASASGTATDTKQARTTRAYAATGTATDTSTKVLLKSIAAAATGTATLARIKVLLKSIAASATGTATDTKQARHVTLVSAAGTAVDTKRASIRFAAAATGTALGTPSKALLRQISAAATGVAHFTLILPDALLNLVLTGRVVNKIKALGRTANKIATSLRTTEKIDAEGRVQNKIKASNQ